MPALFLDRFFKMMHSKENCEKLNDRLVVILRERALCVQAPEDHVMISASLAPPTEEPVAQGPAERFGIVNPAGLKRSLSDTMALLVASKISKPSVIKSEADEVVQEGHDRGVDEAIEKYRIADHLQAMRRAGHSRAGAGPQRSNFSSSGGF